ncbi:MAG: HAMP domain-containing protein [Paucibacter sp.]|nr:HAMP domain-containing protein [Roseateles sp.]
MSFDGKSVAFHQSVTGRLWLALVAVIAALVLMLGTSAARTSSLQQEAKALTTALEVKRSTIADWVRLISNNVLRVQAMAVATDPAVDKLFKADSAAAVEEIGTLQKSIEAMDLTPADRKLFGRIGEERKAVLESLNKVRELKNAGNAEAAVEEVTNRFNPAVAVYLKSMSEFMALQKTQTDELNADIEQRRGKTIAMAGLMLLVIVVGLVLGTRLLVRSIKQPLDEASKLARQIADGDLSVQVTQRGGDEFGALLESLNVMVTQLRRVVGDVRTGVESVSTASTEIAQGNHDLSARTEQTASSLEETASAMEELTATVSHSADTATQANQLAASAAEAAARGGQVVEQVVSNMQQISESSHRISDIIGTIDGIAFQTNILALNAAVEAARAGEQGRGFAVVAGEVRSLAQRSAEAAKEIKSLIQASVERVESGSRLVGDTGTAMNEIVTSVRRVTDMIGEIASSAAEQRDGIAQVNIAVTELDRMTQQNAALVEESAAAAQSMRDQANRLAEVVSVFRTGSGSSARLAASLANKAAPAPARPVAGKPLTAPRAAATRPAATKPAAPQARGGKPPAPKAQAHKPMAPAPAKPVGTAPATDEGDWETF